MKNHKSFIFLIISILAICINSTRLKSAEIENDSLYQEIRNLKSVISKLDSTINKLQSEHQTIIALTEKDINTAQNLINVSQTITEIIAVMLAIFSVVGGILIGRLLKQSRQVRKEHRILKKDWNTTRKEIEKINETVVREGKELFQILFYMTEGDAKLYTKTEESVEFYKEALKIRDDRPQVYAKLGQAYFLLGKYDEAIDNFEKGFYLDPINTLILSGLAEVYIALEQYDKAEDYYKKTLEIDQNDTRALWGLGHTYLYKREVDKAELYYKKSQMTDSAFFSNFNLAFIYACKKDNEISKNYAEKALELIDTKMADMASLDWVLWRKGILFLLLKKYDLAKNVLLEIKRIFVNSVLRNNLIKRLKILNEISKNKNIEELINILEVKNNE